VRSDRRSLPIGVVVGSGLPPERLGPAARVAEGLGFDEVWVSEDFFFSGGIAGAALALAATRRIRIGLGVVSALVRHPALLAMELATLARAHPDRLVPGIGLGVPAWMGQMGLDHTSPLSVIRECVTIVRALLDGDVVDHEGRTFSLHDGHLVHPAPERLPIQLGVIGPKLLGLAGEVADGTVLSVLGGEAYIRFARERIEAGRAKAGRTDPHPITLFVLYSVSRDAAEARRAARAALAFYSVAGGVNALTDAAGISDELRTLMQGGVDAVRDGLPESWIADLTVSGSPDEVAERLRCLGAAGADAIALFPVPADRADEMIALTATDVLPLLG
jgi:alkanesulfonate monooxygenase SsuD/methylene tetrahydromethanopterin reductase-like flavin-dependent oxidoreductase (luciferase family)